MRAAACSCSIRLCMYRIANRIVDVGGAFETTSAIKNLTNFLRVACCYTCTLDILIINYIYFSLLHVSLLLARPTLQMAKKTPKFAENVRKFNENLEANFRASLRDDIRHGESTLLLLLYFSCFVTRISRFVLKRSTYCKIIITIFIIV